MGSPSSLPDEIWVSILDYIISLQRGSRRLFKLARDNSLWRNKCFEKAPSSSSIKLGRPEVLSDLTGALSELSLSDSPQNATLQHQTSTPLASRRARGVAQWDHTGEGELVDWYTEYIGRHAPLHTTWSERPHDEANEIRGVAVNALSTHAVGCREDGSIAIWDIRPQEQGGRRFRQVARSEPAVLLQPPIQSSSKSAPPVFSGVVECLHLDSIHNRAYIAVERTLNEVDLETLKVVSQESYAWNITALSQQGSKEVPISVGTTWSLHLYDPRVPLRDRSRSPEDLMRSPPGDPEDSIAFLPNYAKGQSLGCRPLPTSQAPTMAELASNPAHYLPRNRRGRTELSDYAHVEPGPLSILHNGEHDILVAGRFPSILSYDRRYFPRLQSVIHSGARLSSLASIPFAPKSARDTPATATLIAAGEYGGRGSLELYSLPHGPEPRHRSSDDSNLDSTSSDVNTSTDNNNFAFESPLPTQSTQSPTTYSYKNRQEASSAKLLSVATQGTRIVFSDAEGGLKWVERDGRGLVRRWNINEYMYDERGGKAGASGEMVARKIVPLREGDAVGHSESGGGGEDGGVDGRASGRGSVGNGDLLIWTGDRLGIVSTRPRYEDHEALVREVEEGDGEGEERVRAEEYSKTMRQALERQADERRWMSRFRLKRGLF